MNKWNKDNPSRNFDSEVLEDIPAGKNARNIALVDRGTLIRYK